MDYGLSTIDLNCYKLNILDQFHDIQFLIPLPYLRLMLIGAVLLWLVLMVLLFWRKGRRRLWFRIPVTTLAILCLLALGLRPFQFMSEDAITAVLLTTGFERGVADSLLAELPAAQLFSMEAVLGFDRVARQIPDAHFLARNYPRLEEVFVLGNGLHEHELTAFQKLKSTFLLNDFSEGISNIGYPKYWTVDETFFVQGNYHHTNKNAYWLVLEGQSGASDSILFDQEQTYFFDLKQPLSQPGKYLFQLLTKNRKGQVLNRERFPVFVAPKEKLRMVLISDSPSFEVKNFKNRWSDKGHQIAVRSAISSGKFKTEFINRPKINLDKIDKLLLAETDIFLTTIEALQQFSESEYKALQQAVQNGMGMVIWGSDKVLKSSLSSSYRTFFLDFSCYKTEQKELLIAGNDFGLTEDFTLPVNGFSFGEKGSKIAGEVAAYRNKAYGRIALLRSSQTYKMLLDGKQELYDAIWSEILKTTNRAKPENRAWTNWEEQLVFKDLPAQFQLTSTEIKPVGQLNSPQKSIPFYLAQHPYNSEQWQGKVWPKSTGWHTLSTQKYPKNKTWCYVYGDKDWQALRTAARIQQNRDWVAQRDRTQVKKPVLQKNVERRFPLWWFYVGLLLCWGLLWLEEKV